MRKPVTTYAGGKGPRQRVWEAIRAQCDAEWTRVQIAALSGIDGSTLSSYIQSLEHAGIVKMVRQKPGARKHYRLINDEGVEAPRLRTDGTRCTQGLVQEQMWRTLRMMRGDTNARELAAHASTPRIPVAFGTANEYLKTLKKAGYLEVTLPGKGGSTQRCALARYRLIPSCNTGPRPPVICKTRTVYDPNVDKIVWQAPVSDEDAIYG